MTEQENTNSALVHGLQRKAPEALRELWARYEDKLYASCARILGGGPDARDVTWDVLVEFSHKYVDTLANPEALGSFLHLMAVRRALRFRKKQGRSDEYRDDFSIDAGGNPDELAELRRFEKPLNLCLKKLSPKMRQAIRLKYRFGMSHADIALVLGVSKTIVGRLTRKSLEMLRRCILTRLNTTHRFKGKWRTDGSGSYDVEAHTIERLLRVPATPKTAMCDHLEAAALDLERRLAGIRPETAGEVPALCDDCRRAVQELETQWRLDARPPDISSKAALALGAWRLTALAALVAVGLLTGVLIRFGQHPEAEMPTPKTLQPKSPFDRISVAVKRGEAVQDLRPMARLQEKDHISLRYTARKRGYLMVLTMDEQRHVTVLYPTGATQSGRIDVGVAASLPAGGIVREGKGCEWIVGVFSDTPLSIERGVTAMATAALSPVEGMCDIEVSIPEARAVSVLPVIR